MGDGNTSSYRWHRTTVPYEELLAERNRLAKICEQQAITIAKLNKLLIFQHGDEVIQ